MRLVDNATTPGDLTADGVKILCELVRDTDHKKAFETFRSLDDELTTKVIEIANEHWIAGELYENLKAGSTEQHDACQYLDYLSEIYRAFVKRNQSIDGEARNICELLNQQDIRPIFFKGAAYLVNGVLEKDTARFMSDIDIYVPGELHEKATEVLLANGYSEHKDPDAVDADGHHHGVPLLRDGGACYVELHKRLLKTSADGVLKGFSDNEHIIKVSNGDVVDACQLSPSYQVIVQIAHSEIADAGFENKSFELRQLLTFSRLVSAFTNDIDWAFVCRQFELANATVILESFVYSANQLFGTPIPFTLSNPDAAEKHYNECLNQSSQHLLPESRVDKLTRVLKGYDRETIANLYGDNGAFPILRGRLKHLYRHVLLLLKIN